MHYLYKYIMITVCVVKSVLFNKVLCKFFCFRKCLEPYGNFIQINFLLPILFVLLTYLMSNSTALRSFSKTFLFLSSSSFANTSPTCAITPEVKNIIYKKIYIYIYLHFYIFQFSKKSQILLSI